MSTASRQERTAVKAMADALVAMHGLTPALLLLVADAATEMAAAGRDGDAEAEAVAVVLAAVGLELARRVAQGHLSGGSRPAS